MHRPTQHHLPAPSSNLCLPAAPPNAIPLPAPISSVLQFYYNDAGYHLLAQTCAPSAMHRSDACASQLSASAMPTPLGLQSQTSVHWLPCPALCTVSRRAGGELAPRWVLRRSCVSASARHSPPLLQRYHRRSRRCRCHRRPTSHHPHPRWWMCACAAALTHTATLMTCGATPRPHLQSTATLSALVAARRRRQPRRRSRPRCRRHVCAAALTRTAGTVTRTATPRPGLTTTARPSALASARLSLAAHRHR